MMNRKQEIEIEHGTSEIDTHGGRGGKAAFSVRGRGGQRGRGGHEGQSGLSGLSGRGGPSGRGGLSGRNGHCGRGAKDTNWLRPGKCWSAPGNRQHYCAFATSFFEAISKFGHLNARKQLFAHTACTVR